MSGPADAIAARIGRRVRDRRLELGLSQVDLARHLGITYQQVQKYERGTNRIAANRLQDLARILDVPIPYFYGGAGMPPGLAEVAADLGPEITQDADRRRDEEALLVDAFRRIQDGRVRQRFVALIEAVAGPPGPRDVETDG